MIDQIEKEDSSELSIQSKTFLNEAAGWARFLGIVGFVLLGLATIVMLFAGSAFAMLGGVNSGLSGTFLLVFFLIFGTLWFFVCFYLVRFGGKMKEALQFQSRELLDLAFENLKSYFKLLGILTIIYLALLAINIVFGGLMGIMR